MIRFALYEYIRNIWFNICMIMIISVMMLTSIMFVSNIDSQTKLYRLTGKYLEDDSIFVNFADKQLMSELDNTESVLIARTLSGCIENSNNIIRTTVYSDEIMKYLKPMLDEGTYPDRVYTDENTVAVLISHNPYGIKPGDSFTYKVLNENGEYTDINIYVSGIISEGQKIYNGNVEVSVNMTYEDFFTTYSYEQSGDVVMIINENELEKAGDFSKLFYYRSGIINLKDDISEEDRNKNIEIIRNYEKELFGSATVDVYPEAQDMIARGEKLFTNIIMKYIPLLVVVCVLLVISIIGIVTIKTIKSTRYYGIMYACGMHYGIAQLMMGIEMGINCLAAVIFSVSIIVIQNKIKLIGTINCRLEMPEIAVIGIMCIIIILCSVFTTKSILKESTPSKILKNTV